MLLLLFPMEVHCTSPYENDRPLFLFLNGAVNSASLLEMLRNYEGSWNRCCFRKTGLQLISPSLGVYFLIKPFNAAGFVAVLHIMLMLPHLVTAYKE